MQRFILYFFFLLELISIHFSEVKYDFDKTKTTKTTINLLDLQGPLITASPLRTPLLVNPTVSPLFSAKNPNHKKGTQEKGGPNFFLFQSVPDSQT